MFKLFDLDLLLMYHDHSGQLRSWRIVRENYNFTK